MTRTRVEIVDARPTQAQDLELGDRVNGYGRYGRLIVKEPYGPGRVWLMFTAGPFGASSGGSFDTGHHFYLVTS